VAVIRSETCLEGAVRATVGLLAVGLGHLGGTLVGGLFPTIGPLVYAISVLPFGVAGLYAVATGAWVVVEGASLQALERHAAAAAAEEATAAESGDAPDDSS
jgi:hypothetical protein